MSINALVCLDLNWSRSLCILGGRAHEPAVHMSSGASTRTDSSRSCTATTSPFTKYELTLLRFRLSYTNMTTIYSVSRNFLLAAGAVALLGCLLKKKKKGETEHEIWIGFAAARAGAVLVGGECVGWHVARR